MEGSDTAESEEDAEIEEDPTSQKLSHMMGMQRLSEMLITNNRYELRIIIVFFLSSFDKRTDEKS